MNPSGSFNRAEHPQVSTFARPRQLRTHAGLAHRIIRVILVLVVGLVLTGGGCTTVPAPATEPYPIAVRYDVEPRFVGLEPSAALDAIGRDFQTIAELGFTAVVLRHVEDADRVILLDLAGNAGLKASVPDRSVDYYVITGALPPSCSEVPGLVRALPREVMGHPGWSGLVVGPVRGADTARRAEALQQYLRDRRIASVQLGGDRSVPSAGGFAAIDATVASIDPEASPLERWLAQYHAALSAGRTDALAVDRYRRPPGDPTAVSTFGGVIDPARKAAIDALISRARHWGPRLRGFTAQAISDARTDEANLHASVLTKGRRRYVLICNNAADVYAHGEVVLPESIGGQAATRAVEVPPSSDRPAGRVVDARRGRITVEVSLRPGDAVLFEIF